VAKQKRKIKRIVAVADFETDPFRYGRIPKPFAAGLMYVDPERPIGNVYQLFWGADCVNAFLMALSRIGTPLTIYMHNGGKFDFHFFLKYLENPIKIIHGRIVKARIGIHEFRDSWAIIPMPLAGYAKTKIDYSKMEAENRETHKSEISAYLFDDCRYLYDLVSAFNDRFGPKLTIASTAQKELQKFHPQYNQKRPHDELFRPYYFGGRVECFESGILPGNWRVYDVNSMYPFVMRECLHPLGSGYISPAVKRLDKNGWFKDFPGRMYFARVRGRNTGALPSRVEDSNGGLSFTEPHGVFHTTSHELRLALSLGLFEVEEIEEAFIPRNTQSFAEFVDTFVAEKIVAKETKDKIAETFAKLILNSAYGRFGINPYDFFDYHIQIVGDARPLDTDDKADWEPYEKNNEFTLWRRRVNDPADTDSAITGFEDVAIAASITSAARAVLMLAIVQAKRPIYCDTDSLICEQIRNVEISESALGAWKLEAKGNRAAIAGKKLYALFDGDTEVKSASKGVKLTGAEIVRVAQGETIDWKNDAPNFSLLGGVRFVHRRAKSTIRK
jgi:DNA polymerase type B, organellar and viral